MPNRYVGRAEALGRQAWRGRRLCSTCSASLTARCASCPFTATVRACTSRFDCLRCTPSTENTLMPPRNGSTIWRDAQSGASCHAIQRTAFRHRHPVLERLAYHAQQGHGGAELYRQLASDAEVAPFSISLKSRKFWGVSGEALKQRRALGRPPEYIKFSQDLIRYPETRFACCSPTTIGPCGARPPNAIAEQLANAHPATVGRFVMLDGHDVTRPRPALQAPPDFVTRAGPSSTSPSPAIPDRQRSRCAC